jgi:hypothetical protein
MHLSRAKQNASGGLHRHIEHKRGGYKSCNRVRHLLYCVSHISKKMKNWNNKNTKIAATRDTQ